MPSPTPHDIFGQCNQLFGLLRDNGVSR